MDGVDDVLARRTPLPRIDVHAPLILLPGLFRVTRETIPGVPYITVEDSLVEEWRQRLGSSSERTIGIVWASGPNPPFRSTSLQAFSALADVPNIRLVSLQHGPSARELADVSPNLRVEVFPEESRSICDTAALIANLDLVISVDTMVAHLSGALGRPTWTLLCHAPSWRWQAEGETTPWYPTARLFRQTRLNEWSDVFERVRAALLEGENERQPVKTD
jgi:hypothetical protein